MGKVLERESEGKDEISDKEEEKGEVFLDFVGV